MSALSLNHDADSNLFCGKRYESHIDTRFCSDTGVFFSCWQTEERGSDQSRESGQESNPSPPVFGSRENSRDLSALEGMDFAGRRSHHKR